MDAEQLEILRMLSEKVHYTYERLVALEDKMLELSEQRYTAKETLAHAIDDAYENGEVIGKNEREREAYLRKMLPAQHNEIVRLDAMIRGLERELNRERRMAERLVLQVEIAKMVSDVKYRLAKTQSMVQ